jgi:putative ABC transport system permease protein
MLRGRTFDARDTANSQPVAIINRTLAKQYFGNKNPVGRQIFVSDPGKWYAIIGIVPTVKIESIDEKTAMRMIYVNAAQAPERTMYLVMNTAVPPELLFKPLHELMGKMDSAVAVFDIETMHNRLADALQNQRATLILILAFGGIALALAMIGVYGVMSYAVGQRRVECGIRLALGAEPADILWLIIKDGLKLLGIGLIVGLLLAVIFGFVLSSRLFGVAPFDPMTLIGTAVVLSGITLVACYLPARRAAQLDPAIAMMEQ